MARNAGHTGTQQRAAHVAAWLDDKLVPVLGPPPLGPYGADDPQPEAKTNCPICGEPLKQHRLERDGAHSYLHCPNGASVFETGRVA